MQLTSSTEKLFYKIQLFLILKKKNLTNQAYVRFLLKIATNIHFIHFVYLCFIFFTELNICLIYIYISNITNLIYSLYFSNDWFYLYFFFHNFPEFGDLICLIYICVCEYVHMYMIKYLRLCFPMIIGFMFIYLPLVALGLHCCAGFL